MQKLLLDKLLAIIVLAGILAAVAIPVFLNQQQKGYDAALAQVSHYQFSGVA